MESSRHVVVSGASIAGLSAAFWLTRIGWRVTVVERAPAFREGGQNVDVRGVAHEVLDRMGLTEAVKVGHTSETGTVFVDEHGEVTVELPTDGQDSATAELEILRGDFAKIIRDALPDDVTFSYGNSIQTVDDATGTVTLASGEVLRADLVVVAEGVRSSTRDRLFDGQVGRHELGVSMAFGTIPRTATDDDHWRWYTATNGRQVHLRPDNHGTTRAILACTGERLAELDTPEALRRLNDRFADAGWEAPRVLAGFDTSDDVYVDDLTQIQMDTWHRGRVCLIGDAAWCVTPMGGGGSSLALTAGYVLAAYLSTADLPSDGSSAGDPDRMGLEQALRGYEEWMRPLVDGVQTMPRGLVRAAYPHSRLGVRVRDLVVKVATSPPVSRLGDRTSHIAVTDEPLPDMCLTTS